MSWISGIAFILTTLYTADVVEIQLICIVIGNIEVVVVTLQNEIRLQIQDLVVFGPQYFPVFLYTGSALDWVEYTEGDERFDFWNKEIGIMKLDW